MIWKIWVATRWISTCTCICLFTDTTCEEHVANKECPKTLMVIKTITHCLLKSYMYTYTCMISCKEHECDTQDKL